MRLLRFEVEGVLNSYRVPFFRTYHKTTLAPPKTAIVGLLCNISLKSQNEFFEILNTDKLRVSVIIEDILGKTKDMWSYRKLSTKTNRGRSIVRRDKLFGICYKIYMGSEDSTLFEELYNALKAPKAIPAFGMDDELINIKNIQEIEQLKTVSNRIDSIFMDEGRKFAVKLKEPGKVIEMPQFVYLPVKFKAFDKKGKRVPKEPTEFVRQVEFFNCYVEFEEDFEHYVDQDCNFVMY